MEKRLSKGAFANWLRELSSYDVYLPVEDEGRSDYEIIEDTGALGEDYTNAVVGPKEVIFPRREALLKFGSKNENAPEIEEVIAEVWI